MPIYQKTPQREIDKMIETRIQRMEEKIIYTLSYIGESAVNIAKETRGYTDRTSNLVSSIGYVLVKDGRVLGTPNFEAHKKGYEGKNEGEKFAAEKAATLIPYGYGIVLVAGMKYAAYVEATGRNVLALSEIEARKMAETMLKDLYK